jgi:hypothetical protein
MRLERRRWGGHRRGRYCRFYNFAPAMVARAIPDAWRFASPERVLKARYAAVGRALDRLIGHDQRQTLAQATELLEAAATGCDVAGRPMYAANAALGWPDEPLQRLWHATSLLREHRGDGHVTALLAHQIDGCQAHVLASAAGVTPAEQLRPNRGWTNDAWDEATERLHRRGLLTVEGDVTDRGRTLHGEIERLTDQLAKEPWGRISRQSEQNLLMALDPILQAIHGSKVIPYPNPMGLPAREGMA